jgi:uncharacterized membrane protein YeaQ/YmgE (transglycosylase-associated protein family)
MTFLLYIVLGLVAGWLATLVLGVGGFGFFGDIAVGALGSVIGGYLFGELGIFPQAGLLSSFLSAFLGAVLLLLVLRLLQDA